MSFAQKRIAAIVETNTTLILNDLFGDREVVRDDEIANALAGIARLSAMDLDLRPVEVIAEMAILSSMAGE